MPYIKGVATSLNNLLEQITAWVTDENIHGEDVWTVKRNEPWPRGTIYEAKGLNGINKSYIGVMLVDFVKGSSYKNWLCQTDNILKHIVRSNKGLNLANASIAHTEGNANFTLNPQNEDEDPILYTMSDLEIVSVNSSALVFGVFKQYNEGLDWNEQPGALEPSNLVQYEISCYKHSGSGNGLRHLPTPVYPGVGYPGFGMSTADAQNKFKFWVTKDECHITVVVNNGEQWDMGHAGMLVPYQSAMQYPFPAVMAGSNTGLRMISSGDAEYGTLIDYTYNNYSMSRSLPCAPCLVSSPVKRAENSNVVACLPDGTWKYFSNWVQTLTIGNADVGGMFWYHARPVRANYMGYRIRPLDTDLSGVVDSIFNTDVTVERLDLVQHDVTSDSTGMLGSLHDMSWPGLNGPFGEVNVSGKKCLLLPNGWENRMWFYPPGRGGATDQTQLLNLYNDISKVSRQFRMLIRLED